ncbi:MAG: glycosyltransferase family 4 protein [Dechloromonas sp.]|nr:glycosyltransferase family 4 protein [Dechloromonas sp.]
MKILHTEASCGWGGQEIRILSEAQGLIERGHDVHLVCPPEARIFTEAPRFGVPVEALPIGRKRLGGVLAMRAYLKQHPVDVINAHSSTDTWLAALACRLLADAPPIVRTRHISAPLADNRATRWLYADATRYIATTGESLRAQLLETLHVAPERVVSVPTGVDALRYRPADADERAARRAQLGLPVGVPLVGIVATLRSWKGHRFLVEAFAGNVPAAAQLVIVGDGPQREALIAQVAELGLQDRVHLVGNHPDVVPWMQALDVFVLPSYANEGVPQALMQAMACGLPCITTDIGAIPELAQHEATALVVPPQDVAALDLALNRLLGDAQLRQRLGQAARDHVLAAHGRETMLDRMESLFRKACGAA